VDAGELGRYAYEQHAEDDDFGRPHALYDEVMSDADRGKLVSNIVAHARRRRGRKQRRLAQRRGAGGRDDGLKAGAGGGPSYTGPRCGGGSPTLAT
jgi:hypothetical protein